MSQIYISPDTAIGLPLSITDPTEITGATEHSIVVGGAGGQLLSLGVAGDGFFPIGSAGADPVLATITSGRDLEVNPDAGIIEMRLNDNTHETAVHGWNGGILETADVYVYSDGINVAMAVEKDGGGNLTVVFSDGFYDWVTAPDSVALTPGTDVAPTINYVYFLQSTKVLTASTVGWPATEHAPLATVLCQSAASVQTKGAYKVHAWTDHVVSTNEQGHLAHLNYWIREQHATWMSGVAQTLTITPNGGTPDDVIFTNTAGTCLQLHPHTFPAFVGTPDIYTVNDSVTPYNIITDLNELLLDSTGASMAGKYFSLVVWGVISEDTTDCKLMVNLPGGSYNTQAALEADSQNYVNYSMPTNFKGTGFLIYQMDLRHQVAASGTWTSIQSFDLRGQFPSTAAGSSTAFATEFADNVFRIFDDGDNTKKIAFQADQIATGVTREITMCNQDLSLISPQFPGSVTAATDMTMTAGNLNMPVTNAAFTEGTLKVGGQLFLHNLGDRNTFLGDTAGSALNAGADNTSCGNSSMLNINDGNFNSCYGSRSGEDITDGSQNVSMGHLALTSVTTGSLNIAIGADAGINYASTESSNICLSNDGLVGEDNVIRIGTQGSGAGEQDSCFIAGIYGATPAASVKMVIVDVNGELGSTIIPFIINRENVTTATKTMEYDTEYTTNYGAGVCAYTLPTTAAIGTIIEVTGNSANGYSIAQNASQVIHFGSSDTTIGIGGSLASVNRYCCIKLKCVVTDDEFTVVSSSGNFTVV